MSELYKAAGVDIDKGDRLSGWLADSGQQESPLGRVLSGIGGFAGMFELQGGAFERPVLVAATDGVGTKLLLGLAQSKLEGLGIDLVAMCVNDLYTVGAQPLFFLDYYATGALNESQFKEVLTGIKLGLRQCKAALLGGETAELPGLYDKNHFDLAGFVVGVVDKDKVLGPARVEAGDILVGLPSSGFHSNGYSLLRSWVDKGFCDDIDGLLAPTKIYHEIPELLTEVPGIKAMAHITGGGLSGNLVRILPKNLGATIDLKKIPEQPLMTGLFRAANVSWEEVESTFNLGVGMLIAVEKRSVDRLLLSCHNKHLNAFILGSIDEGESQVTVLPRGT